MDWRNSWSSNIWWEILGFVRGLWILSLAVTWNSHTLTWKTDDLIPVLKKLVSKISIAAESICSMWIRSYHRGNNVMKGRTVVTHVACRRRGFWDILWDILSSLWAPLWNLTSFKYRYFVENIEVLGNYWIIEFVAKCTPLQETSGVLIKGKMGEYFRCHGNREKQSVMIKLKHEL